MTGGTDHEIDTEGYYAARLLQQQRESIEDAIYAVRAYAHGLSWGTLLLATGGLCTGLATGNWLSVATSLTGIVGVLLPQLNSTWVNGIITTILIATGRIPQPPEELPIRPAAPAPDRR